MQCLAQRLGAQIVASILLQTQKACYVTESPALALSSISATKLTAVRVYQVFFIAPGQGASALLD